MTVGNAESARARLTKAHQVAGERGYGNVRRRAADALALRRD